MKNKIENLIESVKKTAGLSVTLCNAEEQKVAEENFRGGNLVFQKENATFFLLKEGKEKGVYKILGAGENEKKYAGLLVAAAESFSGEKKAINENELYRTLFLGQASEDEIKKIKAKKPAFNERGIVIKIVFNKEKEEEVSDFLYNYVGKEETLIPIDGGEIALFKSLFSEKDDVNAPNVYARVLAQSVFEETGEKVTVGVGGESYSAEDISVSYAQACAAVALAKETGTEGEVFFYRDFAFYNILKEQPRVRAMKALSDILSDGALKVFSDKELVKTAEVFLRRNLNLSETARELYVHRNTLTYRLDRIERMTGLNIRNFKDALTFKTAKTLFELSKNSITY